MKRIGWSACLALAATLVAGPAVADDLKLAVGQRGNWDTSIAEMGQRAGIFKKHGLELELLYTQGGGETQQAVLSRSVDIGVAVGTLGVLGVAAKGAPLRIIAGEMTGAGDLFWYVPSRVADQIAAGISPAIPSPIPPTAPPATTSCSCCRSRTAWRSSRSRPAACPAPTRR